MQKVYHANEYTLTYQLCILLSDGQFTSYWSFSAIIAICDNGDGEFLYLAFPLFLFKALERPSWSSAGALETYNINTSYTETRWLHTKT